MKQGKNFDSFVKGGGLKSRTSRSLVYTALQFGGSNVIRLISNLILTRILFPEVFGLMALVQVFLGGLTMFSDLGIKTSIMQNERGDDPDFLNTAWTLQVGRGFLFWFVACALAPVAARIYDEPMLLQLLPVVGFNTVINGFATTKVATGMRHLNLGLQTFIQLGTQVLNVLIMIVMALWLQSVWALVWSTLIASFIRVVMFHRMLPGMNNRFRLERRALTQLFSFGRFIFLSTMAGFAINQGDRAILGAFVPIHILGVYNVAMVMGLLPVSMGRAVANRILLPIYRMRPPHESAENRAKIRKVRRSMVGAFLLCTIVLAYGGIYLMDLLYDDRYALAGPMVVLFGLAAVPQVTFAAYGGVMLARGDSKSFFYYLVATAVLQTALLFVGIHYLGVFGAIIAPGLANLLTYPIRVRFLRRHHGNDNLADAVFLTLGFVLNGFACWLHWDQIVQLIG
jgi:O-antigen/teichoic acid export membrane protein